MKNEIYQWYLSHYYTMTTATVTTWDKWLLDDHTPSALVLTAIRTNDMQTVRRLFDKTEWKQNPFELMIYLIYRQQNLSIWNFIISLLTRDDMTKTFIEPVYNRTHTLLTYFCSILHFMDTLLEEKLLSLIDAGCKWDQVVQERTALSYLVHSDHNLTIVK